MHVETRMCTFTPMRTCFQTQIITTIFLNSEKNSLPAVDIIRIGINYVNLCICMLLILYFSAINIQIRDIPKPRFNPDHS